MVESGEGVEQRIEECHQLVVLGKRNMLARGYAHSATG
jgi:hypothetical protein